MFENKEDGVKADIHVIVDACIDYNKSKTHDVIINCQSHTIVW